MTPRLQIIIGIVIILAMIYIVHTIKKNAMDIKYALVWFVVGLVVLILDIFPVLLEKLTSAMGIELPVNMLFFLGFCLAIVIIFMLTVLVSKLIDQVKHLTQNIALLNKRIDEMEENK